MDTGTALVIAVPAAVLGAAGFGLASAAQQRATHEVAVTPTLSPRLIVELLARPMWLLGLVATIVALFFQIVALAFGPLAVVQPLLVTGVAFAAVFSALMSGHRPDPLILLGALLCAAGLSTFLLLARPTAGSTDGDFDLLAGLPLAIALAVVVVGCIFYAATVRAPLSRVLALALATGVLYGVTAGTDEGHHRSAAGGAGRTLPPPGPVHRLHHRPDRLPAEPEHVPGGPARGSRRGRDHQR